MTGHHAFFHQKWARLFQAPYIVFFFFFNSFHLFIFGSLDLVAAMAFYSWGERGYCLAVVQGLLMRRLLLFWSPGSRARRLQQMRHVVSVVEAPGL